MNRKTSKMIKILADSTGRGEKSIKREYYKLSDKERESFRIEMKELLTPPDLEKEMTRIAVDLSDPDSPKMEVVETK